MLSSDFQLSLEVSCLVDYDNVRYVSASPHGIHAGQVSVSLACWLAGRFSEAIQIQNIPKLNIWSSEILLSKHSRAEVLSAALLRCLGQGFLAHRGCSISRLLRFVAIILLGSLACGLRVWYTGGTAIDNMDPHSNSTSLDRSTCRVF